jgi:hypothetical protein
MTMNQSYIYIFTSLQTKQIEELIASFDHIASLAGYQYKIKQISDHSDDISPSDYLLIPIDILSAQNISDNPDLKSIAKILPDENIILLSDGIELSDLPNNFENCPTLDLQLYFNDTETSKSQIVELITDIVLYINRKEKKQKKASVYLGPSDQNAAQALQATARELIHRGYTLVPDIANHPTKKLLDSHEVYFDMLSKVKLAVHFLSPKATLGFPDSLSTGLQLAKTTAKYAIENPGKLKRIIYIPYQESYESEAIEHAIEAIKQDNFILTNAELIQNPIEKFKSIVIAKLEEEKQDAIHVESGGIYFLSDNNIDQQLQNNILDLINKSGKHAIVRNNQLSHMDLLMQHQNNMVRCDSLVLCANSNIDWIYSIISDTKKAPGWGRTKPMQQKIIITNLEKAAIFPQEQEQFNVIGSEDLENLSSILNTF